MSLISVAGSCRLYQLFASRLRCVCPTMQDLIERWSRPIFEQYRERREDEEVRERELQIRQARAARQKAEASAAEQDESQKKVRALRSAVLNGDAHSCRRL